MIPSASPRDRVDQLLRLLRWRSRATAALEALVVSALWCGTVWAALWFVPLRLGRWPDLLLLLPILAAVRGALLNSRSRAVLQAEHRLDLHDALRTWLGARLPPSWAGCLLEQLALDLGGKDVALALPRAQVGRARVLLYALLLLLFVRFGLPDFLGSRGAAGISGQSSAAGSESGPGGGASGGGGSGQPAPTGTPPPPQGSGGGGRPPKQPPPDEGPRTPPGPLPEAERHVDAFVPPAFDRDGPRTEREIEAVERPIGAVPPPASGAAAGSGTPPESPLPDLRPAVEQAIARRRIDPAEAGFMRRYFERLRQERR